MDIDKTPRILLVDDEQDNIRVLAEILKGKYKLLAARNGKVAMECALSDDPPDLILLDIMMPEMDGTEVLKKLKADNRSQDIPVIFITALGKEDNEARCLEMGAVDYITKPFYSSVVTARVQAHVELKLYRDHLERMVFERTEELSKANKRYRDEISERKKAEEKLRLQTSALEAAANAMVITDTKGVILWINKAFTDLTGYAEKDAVGASLPLYVSKTQNKEFYTRMWETISSGKVWNGEIVNRRKDGRLYSEKMTITPVRGAKNKISHFIAIKQDITHEKEMEKKLQQAQKMEAIGTLTGGIAHDFNNILYAVSGYAEMALSEIPEESKAHGYIEQVIDGGKRAMDLVRHILTFSRQTDQERKPMMLQPVLKEALKLLRGSLPSTIKIKQSIDAECGVVLADVTQIHQVIMNLCTNAYHAMREKGGVLSVGIAETTVDAELAKKYPDLKPGKYARLTVKDSGHGMDKETMGRIFEPFFTTKTVGEGTGLGLSTVHGIVKGHGGAILVNSKPGHGATFQALLPVHAEKGAADAARAETEAPFHGNERVLLVDDEKSIVEMSAIQLENHGYKVTPCTGSIEALEKFKAAPDAFDVVITDQTMPDMTGLELAEAMLNIRPDAPIILCTGFSETATEEKAKGVGIQEYLKKPIIEKELSKAIQRVSGKKGAGKAAPASE